MPGAGIVQHRLFDRVARGQRPRCKQKFIARRWQLGVRMHELAFDPVATRWIFLWDKAGLGRTHGPTA